MSSGVTLRGVSELGRWVAFRWVGKQVAGVDDDDDGVIGGGWLWCFWFVVCVVQVSDIG